MKSFYILRIVILLAALIVLSGCGKIFEHDADIQARKALQDLMAIQNQFFAENNRYARNLIEIGKYNLKYHTGIVYLEIESAGKDGYRAVSLPAESTTARVFAFDSEKSGFYEMGEDEVSQYVLGALNFIRDKQEKQRFNDISSIALLGLIGVLGIRFFIKFKSRENLSAFAAFFIVIAPLSWALGMLNYMNPEVVQTSFLNGMAYASILLAVISVALTVRWFVRARLMETPSPLLVFFSTSIVMGLFTGGLVIHNLLTFYKS